MEDYSQILTAMQQRYRALTGAEPDNASDIGIRLKVLAAALQKLYGEMVQVQKQAFPQSATGIYLERHAEARGFARKAAIPAEGVLRFSRTVASATDIQIPGGTICSTRPDPQVQYKTLQTGVLPAGQLYVDIPAQAVDLGLQGNVAAGAICLMVSAAPGITAVTNPAPFADGVDEEDDEALRGRLLQGYRNISNGTNRAYYFDLAMQDDGVVSANVLPRARGRGTVDVVINGTAYSEPATVARLQKMFDVSREINVDVLVRKAARVETAVSVRISLEEGYSFDTVAAACKQEIRKHMAGLGVGRPLLTARLAGDLLSVEGVHNCHVTSPTADKAPGEDKILQAGQITVNRMEE